MRIRGLTLIELLLAIAISGIAVAVSMGSYSSGLSFEKHLKSARAQSELRDRFEGQVTALLSLAEVTSTNATFVSPVPTTHGGSDSTRSGSVVFTTWGLATPTRFFGLQSQSFEDLNARFGARGGPSEVSLSLNPVGDAEYLRGLFIRDQRPPDGDLTQGGEETVLESVIEDINFRFYDGKDWIDTWDSRDSQKGQVPSAVEVTYHVTDDSRPHVFLVRMKLTGKGATS